MAEITLEDRTKLVDIENNSHILLNFDQLRATYLSERNTIPEAAAGGSVAEDKARIASGERRHPGYMMQDLQMVIRWVKVQM